MNLAFMLQTVLFWNWQEITTCKTLWYKLNGNWYYYEADYWQSTLCQVEKLLHLLNCEFVAARFLGASQDALCQVKFVLLKIGQSQVVRMNSSFWFPTKFGILFPLYNNYWLYLQFEDPGFNSGLAQEPMDGDFANLANTVDAIASLK